MTKLNTRGFQGIQSVHLANTQQEYQKLQGKTTGTNYDKVHICSDNW